MAQFMQVSMSNHKSTESTIKYLEIQVGQLAKQIVENSSGGFGANMLDLVASIILRGIGLECRRSNNNQFNNVL